MPNKKYDLFDMLTFHHAMEAGKENTRAPRSSSPSRFSLLMQIIGILLVGALFVFTSR